MLLHYYCSRRKDVEYTGSVMIGTSNCLRTFGQVGNLCIQSMIDAEIALLNLITHLSRGQQDRDASLKELHPLKLFTDRIKTPVVDQVPTASFTELVIQNQIILRRRSVITTLDSTNLTNRYICMSAVRFSPASDKILIICKRRSCRIKERCD